MTDLNLTYNPKTKTFTSPRPQITLPQSPTTSITDFLFRNLHNHPNSPALVNPQTNQVITFTHLKQKINNLANVLHVTYNISKNDVVLIFSPNSILFPIAFFAVTSLGAVVTTANPLYTVDELLHQVHDSCPKLIITVDELVDKVNACVTRSQSTFGVNKVNECVTKSQTSLGVNKVNASMAKSQTSLGGNKVNASMAKSQTSFGDNKVNASVAKSQTTFGDNKVNVCMARSETSISVVSLNYLSDMISNLDDTVSPKNSASSGSVVSVESGLVCLDDVAVILYSSGTTGMSKGVVLTHRSIIATALMVTSDQEFYGDGRSVFLLVVPLFHVMGLVTFTYSQLQRGNAMVVMERFELEKALDAIERYRVTHLFTAPPVVVAMVKGVGVVRKYDTSSLKKIGSGAAPLGKDVMDNCSKVFPQASILQGYGMTETGGIISIENTRVGSRHSGSSGTLCPGMESQIIHIETLEPLPPNQLGEIWVRGPNLMKEYFHNKEATEQTIDKLGWLHTGDLGYFDEEGRIYVVDRLKELIKYKGYQVAPAELEGLLVTHPEIMDAAVIPYTDEEGEIPMAYVVLKSGSSLTSEEVQSFIAKQVSPFKRIRKVAFIDIIPKSAAGKILRRELRQKVQSRL